VAVIGGFVDDVAISLVCEGGEIKVKVQSEQRVGGLDFGANKRRVQGLLEYIRHDQDLLAVQKCSF
jgi:uncharacterized protein (DUF1499 family)